MNLATKVNEEIDRRVESQPNMDIWDLLTLEQQFSVCSLGQMGYLLSFVRKTSHCYMAILKSGNKVATIDCHGRINTSPQIKLRD